MIFSAKKIAIVICVSENPYAAPVAQTPGPFAGGPPVHTTYGVYVNPGGLRTTVVVLLALGGILALVSLFVMSQLNAALESPDTSDENASEIDHWLQLSESLAGVSALILVITVIVWCFWKNRTSKNTWILKSPAPRTLLTTRIYSGPTITPGWAVGYYFIPIVNLWKPYQAMAEIRNYGTDGAGFGPLVGLWWTAWLVMNFGSRYFESDAEEFDTVAQAVSYNEGLMVSNGITLFSTIMAALVVQKITSGQQRLHASQQ